MYDAADLLPLSGLQHLLYCPRQWALIHLEDQWAENRWTTEGKMLHARADTDEVEVRPGKRIARGLYIQCLRVGLSGRADVVEFEAVGEGDLSQLNRDETVSLPGVSGRWRPVPVEYKRGRPKKNNCDRVQLCAQALCLEEMLGVRISSGALFYGKTRRRTEVPMDTALRGETEALAMEMHRLHAAGCTPPPVNDARCEQCSLRVNCMPGLGGRARRGAGWLNARLRSIIEEPDSCSES